MIFPPEVLSNTIVDTPRLEKIVQYLEMTKDLPGDNAEVGVYKGGTSYLISWASRDKKLYIFDTFDGMPETDIQDLHQRGDFGDTSFGQAYNLLRARNNVYIYEGEFPKDSSDVIENKKFSFVHLDCDIYKSVKESLEFFYPRMVVGGIIVFDDYAEPNCPGAKIAVDEFLKDKPEVIANICQSQAIIRKMATKVGRK